MPHVGAHELDKAAVPFFSQSAWVKRWQAPILAGRVVDIGGRADLRSGYHGRRIGPGLGAGPVGAHGEVAVEADRHSPLARRRRRARELFVSHPLQPGQKIQPKPVLRGEAVHGGGGRVPILDGPGMKSAWA